MRKNREPRVVGREEMGRKFTREILPFPLRWTPTGETLRERVEWSFIPPRAPNKGGLWEAGVKAVKYHHRRVMGNLRFTSEEFLTTVKQIEGVLNSSPLYPLS
ncbi:integrase catalytic domain-containing protein [Trichonephila clavipes]|nr:integrase catalytic domain-containing protein [Trichonephila clavipes]